MTQISQSKLLRFLERWRDIEKRQANLDFERSQLAKDIRGEFPTGTTGDQQFVNWCGVELGLTAVQGQELLLRAVAVTLVPDEKTWNVVGGFRAIRPLQDVSKRDQVTVLEAAKSSGKAIRTIMKERNLGPALPALAPLPPPTRTPVRPAVANTNASGEVEHDEATTDCITLTQYLARTGKNLPTHILRLVAKYNRIATPAVVRRSKVA